MQACCSALMQNSKSAPPPTNMYMMQAAAACQAELTRLADAGRIAPFVSERFVLDDTASALQRLADGRTVGRVVLDVRS